MIVRPVSTLFDIKYRKVSGAGFRDTNKGKSLTVVVRWIAIVDEHPVLQKVF
jgi:hypothetical protein